MDIPTLTTSRLTLTPVSTEHSDGMFELWSDPGVCRYSGVVKDYDGNVLATPIKTQAHSDLIIDFWLRAADDGWGFRWAVLLEGEFSGTIGFNSLQTCAEIAYHLIPKHWGKGIMAEAFIESSRWAAAQGITELEAYIEPDNDGSKTLAMRMGMQPTGQLSEGAERYFSAIANSF